MSMLEKIPVNYSSLLLRWAFFEFTVLSFGLQNVPAIFQRLANELLMGMKKFELVCIDNVTVFSKTWEELLIPIDQVLQHTDKIGLNIKPKRRQVGIKQVKYCRQQDHLT